MATFFGEPLRRGCRLFAFSLLLLATPRAGWGETPADGHLHLARARDHAERNEWKPAAQEAAVAVSLLRGSGSPSLPEALEYLGAAELMLGQPEPAAAHFREGLEACRASEERYRLRHLLSSAYRDLGRYGEAESLLKELLAEAETAGSIEKQATSLKGLAAVASEQSHRAEALPLLQEAIRREDAASQPAADRAGVLEAIGVLQSETGNAAQALESLRQAEARYTTQGDSSRLLRIRANTAKAHAALGHYEIALALYGEVEAASRQNGEEEELSRSLNGSGEILQMRGRLDEAQKKFEEALIITQHTGDRRGEARALSHLGQIDLVQGRYDSAYSRFEKALAIARAGTDRESELNALAASADVYLQLNQQDESSARLQEVGTLAGEIATRNQPVEALVAILQLFAANRLDEALAQADQALALARQSSEKPDEAKMLGLRALLLFLLERKEAARLDAEAALALSRELGDRKEEAQWSFVIGYISLHQGHYDEARSSLERALRIEREIGSSDPRAVTLWALGAVYELQWDSTAAIAAYREAVEIYESTFPEVQADDLLLGLAENALGAYGRLARLLAQKGEVEQAFAVAERGRAQAFLRRMGNPPPDLRESVDPALLHQEEALRARLQTLARQASGERDLTARAGIAREIDVARREYETLRIRLQQASPDYASLVHPSTLTVPEVQKLLDDKTALVEYLLLEEQSLVWVIDRSSVHLVRLPAGRAEIATWVEELRQRIAARASISKQSFLLYVRLFSQLEPYLHHANVLVVPDGALHALPFAALTPDVGKTWLIERSAFSVLPGASALPFLFAKRNREEGSMLALGDPDGSLPAAATEARTVAALYQTKALVGRDASAAALRNAPRPIGHLHIAAHATFDPVRPLFSRIRLADGDFAAHEIFGLNLRGTHLVVLSGCETGVGPATDVGELESLSRAFLYAGAPAVVATLWRMDDSASHTLMEAFYRRLRAGTSTAEALRQAQIEILHGEWRHPFFWAGFTLTGVTGP